MRFNLHKKRIIKIYVDDIFLNNVIKKENIFLPPYKSSKYALQIAGKLTNPISLFIPTPKFSPNSNTFPGTIQIPPPHTVTTSIIERIWEGSNL